MGLEFYLISTSHLEDDLWFREESDFKEGMNAVAVTVCLTRIQILAFILMSNHVHFVVQGTREESLRFITLFKRQYSSYLRRKYGVKEALRGNAVDIRQVKLEDESLQRAIAYVLMNCVSANICVHSSLYPWGTGAVLFNPQPSEGRKLDTFSKRSLHRILHTRTELPDHFLVSPSGFILPESYVPVKFLTSLFRTPQRFNWFLMHSSKAKASVMRFEKPLPAFRDQTILSSIPDLCVSMFRKTSLKELNWQETAELVSQVKRRFAADPAQIARVIGISYEETAKMLDAF